MQRDRFAGRKTDPLSLNRYTYCRNNPIIFIDPSGYSYGTLPDGTKFSINSNWDAKKFYELRDKQLTQQAEQAKQKLLDDRINAIPQAKCNDYYDSIDEAAIDFVLQYGQVSIDTWCEYDTVINSEIIEGETKYILGEVGIGEKRMDEFGNPTYKGKGFPLTIYDNTVAYVHTHAQYYDKLNNYFSIGAESDISISYDFGIIAYVGVPNGNILKFDPNFDTVTTQEETGNIIYELAPIDINDPKWKVE